MIIELDVTISPTVPEHLANGDHHLNTDCLLVNVLRRDGSVLRPMVFLGETNDGRYAVARPVQNGHRGVHFMERDRIALKPPLDPQTRLRGQFPSNPTYWN